MPTLTANKQATVLAISDSTGNLARHVLSAVVTQFPAGAIALRYECFVRSATQLDELLREALRQSDVVCHAMVSNELKERINSMCRSAGMPCHDLTGGIARFLERSTRVKPSGDIEALHRLDDAYRRRISAMEYTLCHDDGLGLNSLGEADVVLIGVSRTSKTPTSILLAQMGYHTANISLARHVEPPKELFSVPVSKAVGLLVSPEQLSAIRARRQKALGIAPNGYGDAESVAEEVEWSRKLFRKNGWRVLDVTDQAVEETAARIAQLVGPPQFRDNHIELPPARLWADERM